MQNKVRLIAATPLLIIVALFLSGCMPGEQPPPSNEDQAGGCWQVVDVAPVSSTFVDLTAILAVSDTDIWAVGSTGTPGGDVSRTLTMHWDGTQWSVVPSPNGPNPTGGRNSLYAVSGSSADNVWAVGAYTTGGSEFRTLAMHWDGTQWSVVPTPNFGVHDDELKTVVAFAPDDVWAAGSYLVDERMDGHMIILHWDGKSWNSSPLPQNVTHTLLSITASGPDDIWAVGTQVLHWNGKSWRILPTEDSGAYFDGVTIDGPNSVWVVGNDGTQAITLHWDGTKLNIVPVPQAASTSFLHETVAAKGQVWVAGENVDNPKRAPLLMRWDAEGARWLLSVNPLSGTDARLQGITATPGGTLWAVGARTFERGDVQALFLRYNTQPCAR